MHSYVNLKKLASLNRYSSVLKIVTKLTQAADEDPRASLQRFIRYIEQSGMIDHAQDVMGLPGVEELQSFTNDVKRAIQSKSVSSAWLGALRQKFMNLLLKYDNSGR